MAVDLPVGADLHRYERPGWLCIECGDPWPCQRARAAIVAEYGPGRPVAALTYLASCMYDAIEDSRHSGGVPGLVPDGIWDRFLGWRRNGSGR